MTKNHNFTFSDERCSWLFSQFLSTTYCWSTVARIYKGCWMLNKRILNSKQSCISHEINKAFILICNICKSIIEFPSRYSTGNVWAEINIFAKTWFEKSWKNYENQLLKTHSMQECCLVLENLIHSHWRLMNQFDKTFLGISSRMP